MGGVPFVPRTCAVRQAGETWGRQPPAFPLLGEQPGRTQDAAPRRWQGPRVRRRVEVEDREERVAPEEGRVVVVPARPLAQQHAQP
jgi:hypothetical protein